MSLLIDEYMPVVFPGGIGVPEDQQIHQGDLLYLIGLLHDIQPRNILEIGACQGISSRTFGKYLKDSAGGMVVSVEPDPRQVYYDQRKAHGLTNHMALIEARSPWSHTSVCQAMGAYQIPHFDLLFIDGMHRFLPALVDFYVHQHLVRPDGFVAFHDTRHMSEVKDAVVQLIDYGYIEPYGDAGSLSTAGLDAFRILHKEEVNA